MTVKPTWTVVAAGVALAATACLRIYDPSESANTDAGLQVWAQVGPRSLSISDTVTQLRIRVYARNPGLDTIRVENGGPPCDTTPDPVNGRGLLHSMRIASPGDPLNAGPGGDLCGANLIPFGPRRTRTRDFFVSIKSWKLSGRPLVSGEYQVRSYFAGFEGDGVTFTLVP